MLRDKNLIPLSHQHQHALSLCVRIERSLDAGKADLGAWQVEIQQHYAQEIRFHFAAEEQVLFTAAQKCPELVALVDELIQDHSRLRTLFDRAAHSQLDRGELGEFAKVLSGHIRKEERQLFEAMQKLISAEDMADLGRQLEQSIQEGNKTCILPQGGSPRTPK